MEENKDLQPEEKKTTKTTGKTATTKKVGTTGTAKKATTKRTVKKESTSTNKKANTGTAKKTTARTTKKVAQTPKDTIKKEEKVVEEIVEPVESIEVANIEKIEKVDLTKQEEKVEEEQPKTTEIKKEEEPKFKPAPKVEKKKKKHTLLKGILILIIIALVLFLVHFARNYVIIDSILAKQEALQEVTNYSYIVKHKYSNSTTTMEIYHKGQEQIQVNNMETNRIILWSSLETKEAIFLNPKELTATVQSNVEEDTLKVFHNIKPLGILYYNEQQTRGLDFMYFITSETVNGIDCYKVQWMLGDETSWYNKESGVLVKQESYGYVTEYTDWKINQLTDEDMLRPNLMGYEINE